MVTPQFGFYEH